MIEAIKNTVQYFRCPANYFWQWAEGGEIIEWKNGATICYRDDLLQLLKKIQVKETPSLSAVLLLLSCCNDNFHASGGRGILAGMLAGFNSGREGKYGTTKEILQHHLYQALKFMDIVAALPPDLRKGRHRIHLCHEIFSPGTFSISEPPLKAIAEELDSGMVDKLAFTQTSAVRSDAFKKDLEYLSKALQQYNTAEHLEMRLRTGLNQLPAAIEIPQPEEKPLDLWQQLSLDNKTAGVARLARHLIAALNIPMHSYDRSDLSFGGIADITNRGNYDRLLLSELAHDDDLLMARLVNNEALYFHREAPPDNPKLQRTILIDTTIKMWGLPRVFAVSAALACCHNLKHGELAEAYILYGKNYTQADLFAKEGIIRALGMLDHSLHCGASLQLALKSLQASAMNEFMLITDAQSLHNPDFYACLAEVKESLNFLITVSRTGELHFYEYIKGRIKLLSKAKFDLEELLFATTFNHAEKKLNDSLPAFLQATTFTLMFPAHRLNLTGKNKTVKFSNEAIITFTETQRVLLWTSANYGAREILDFIEKGEYYVGNKNDQQLYILVYQQSKDLARFYNIHLQDLRADVSETIGISRVSSVSFCEEYFVVRHVSGVSFYDYREARLLNTANHSGYDSDTEANLFNCTEPEQADIKDCILSNYSLLFNVRDIHVSGGNELILGNHVLRVHSDRDVSILENTDKIKGSRQAKQQGDTYFPLKNKNIKFNKWLWADGSEAVIDSRGFVHLKSSDSGLPEITVVMILGKATACWASDGAVCGSEYFTGVTNANMISAELFNKKYIQPFISHLL
ncbi:hypothetical protein [Foetidibacter luteolus]|uniref:hypothetical protein n=1 Tax=Foetidibacter luteolus TaxID=2608880 RepID=UPI00129A2D5C|nr:hypothetical protein [Foetidibacter luteolus]